VASATAPAIILVVMTSFPEEGVFPNPFFEPCFPGERKMT
jgi:hypothetical protein